MSHFRLALCACAAVCIAMPLSRTAAAHGILGDRFFPPTVVTDDPFAVDELAFPTVSLVENGAADGTPKNFEVVSGMEFDKEIFPHFAIGVSDDFISQRPDRGPPIHGWDDLSLTAKYELWENAEHEAIVSIGIDSDVGGTGGSNVADTFSTVTPTLYWGKGFGDLPDSLGGLRPFAITGILGESFPTGAAPNALAWGFAVEYSLPYLQSQVADIGLPRPFKEMVPVVEFAMQTTENRGQAGLTTGTVNPGVLWDTDYFQIGVEANVPVNRASGTHVGVTIQAWIFIDDLFPHVFGHPLFGGQP